MTQPSDSGAAALELALGQARQALGSPADVARLRQGLETKLAQGASPQLSAAGKGGALWPKWLLVAALGGAGGLYALQSREHVTETAAPASLQPIAATATAQVITGVSAAPLAASPQTQATPQPPAARQLARAGRPRSKTTASQPVDNTHAPASAIATQRPPPAASAEDPDRELALISRAQHVLRTRPLEALASLEEHGQRFPHGLLAQERDALRIDAERALGRDAQAAEHARLFIASYPSSPQARPLSRWLAAEHKTSAADRHTP